MSTTARSTLGPNAVKVWRLYVLVGTGTVVALGAVWEAMGSPLLSSGLDLDDLIVILLCATVLLGGIADWLILIPRRALNFSYGIEVDALVVAEGRIFRRETHIPLHQILNISVRSGPALRRYGLVNFEIGILGEKRVVPCLSPEAADKLRNALLAVRDDIEVQHVDPPA